MAKSLFPVFEVPEFIEDISRYDTQYKRSVKWSPAKGDFVRDGAYRMVECDGKEAYAIWCYKIAQTERYCCMAYPDSIGTEMEKATSDGDAQIVKSMVQRTITEALMVNPRTEWVRNFVFDWNGDSMTCTFEVKGIEWDEIIHITI